MSRESRLVVILVVIAALGVLGLILVANQYGKALQTAAPERAEARDASLGPVEAVDDAIR
jgi:hypothetical protein